MTGDTHVLVVDDNATNRKLIAALLAHEGYRVSEAADGAEALAVARTDQPQLVISDILMPTMDGYEFVRRLRADASTAALRVIFYTANYHEREALSLARQCGVSRVITKPCPATNLLRAVAEVLAGEAAVPPETESSFDVEHLRLLTDKLSQNSEVLRIANSRLAALTELNLQMASEHDPRQLLHSVCIRARALLGARFSVIAVTDKQRPDSLMTFVSGLPLQQISGIHLEDGVLGRVFAERLPQRLVREDGEALDLGLPAVFPDVRAALAAPVCSLTRTYGWLCLGEKVGAGTFDAEDERLLTILGAQLGRIYENGSLYREMQEQAAQLMVEIDERSRASEQLRASEERFRELAEKIHDVFFVAGPDLVETSYVSPGFERIWGRPAAFILHRQGSWLETVHPADHELVKSGLQKILEAFPEQGQLEFRIVRPDNSVCWVLTRIFPVLDKNGTVVRTVGVTKDITESKAAELELRQTQQAVLQQERLSAVGQMASGIAHDINNAITPAMLYVENLLDHDSELSPLARQSLPVVLQAIEDVAATVARLRDFYRPREMQAPLTPVDANQLVEQVVSLTRARWSDMPQQSGIQITIDRQFAPDLPKVLGAESELREALTNLVFNAADAMTDGGVLTLRTSLQGSTVQVDVSDTGIGMDDETRRKCLEPFFTTKGERGTGLGLAMVYGTVKRHGAEIRINSALAKGTTFSILFPVAEQAGGSRASETLEEVIPKGLRLLVIDDDALLLRSLCETLEMDDHLVTTAGDGRAGVDTFRNAPATAPFAAVITDLGMPRMDGQAVARAIKEISPSIPIILLTGWGQRPDAGSEALPHIDLVIGKPPRLHDLRAALAQCVRAQRLPD